MAHLGLDAEGEIAQQLGIEYSVSLSQTVSGVMPQYFRSCVRKHFSESAGRIGAPALERPSQVNFVVPYRG